MTRKWTEDLSVGVDAIDAQHKELFATADALLVAVERGEGQGDVTKVIVFLEEYVGNHFQMEEMYMKRYNYLDSPSHKSEHPASTQDFSDPRQELDNDGVTPELTVRLADRIGEWLANHIGQMDKALGTFLRGRR